MFAASFPAVLRASLAALPSAAAVHSPCPCLVFAVVCSDSDVEPVSCQQEQQSEPLGNAEANKKKIKKLTSYQCYLLNLIPSPAFSNISDSPVALQSKNNHLCCI